MKSQNHLSPTNSNLFTCFSLIFISTISMALAIPIAQAATVVSESLLPPTLTQTLEQPLQTEQKESKALTHTEMIDQATSQSADAHIITKNKDGSVRIPSPVQDVIATLTPKGASIYSDDKAGENFALLVNSLGRDKGKLTKIKSGKINHDEKIARLFRNNLIEEFSTSSGGIRQDFVIPISPTGKGKLVLELDIEGATVSKYKNGAMLTLKSGRELAYHNLMVADASGQTLAAHFTVKNKNSLQIIVDDKGATYPVRIDPTITDADWFSLGNSSAGIKGEVHAIVTDGAGNLYVGGNFSGISGIANSAGIAKWDGSGWSSLGSGINTLSESFLSISALVWVGTNLYAGGQFTDAGGVVANNIATWDGSTWSAVGSGISTLSGGYSSVESLAWDGANLYAGGQFNSAGGVNANNIAKWDGSNWNPLGSGTNGRVWALIWNGSNIYIGGTFTTVGGIDTNNIAMWDGSAWSSLGSGINTLSESFSTIIALVWDGTNLYAGGHFSDAGGIITNNIAVWDGSAWNSLGSGVSNLSGAYSSVKSLAWDGANLYAGGGFKSAGGVNVSNIAKWDGSIWSALGSGMNSGVYTLIWDGANLYAGGQFVIAGSVTASRIAKWDSSSWSPLEEQTLGLNHGVSALVMGGTNLYIGGGFTVANNIITNHVAKWDGNNWSALGSGIEGYISALAWDGASLYAGGRITTAGGVNVNNIAKWDGSAWSALGSGMDDNVFALAWDGTNLYAGGWFTSAGGLSVNNIARWNGTSWSSLGSGVDDSSSVADVQTLHWDGANLYAGGSFITAGGVSANNIARWDGTSWSALGSGVNSSVYALASNGGNLYAGGFFTTAGNITLKYIAKWDGTSWSALGSGVGPLTTSGLSTGVIALTWAGSHLYAGGRFSTAGGVSANNIARWNGTSWSALGSGVSGGNRDVLALVSDGTSLYAGGHFTSAGDKDAGYIAEVTFPWSFTDLINVNPNTLITSETLSIMSINDNVDISISGGEYSLNSSPFTSATGTINNNDTLQLRTTSSASYNTTTDVVVSIGSGGNTWSVTTLTDTVPDAFSFIDQTEATRSTLINSNTVLITGLGASSVISISGGEYSINGGAYTSIDGLINNNENVSVRTISSANWHSSVDVVLTIGGISDTFTITTDADTDGDDIGDDIDDNDDDDDYDDEFDNCRLVKNKHQRDTDNDGFGNACDADFNNDNMVNSLDIGPFANDFFSSGDLETDLNGDNIVNSLDLGLFKQQFLKAPGPSGLNP